MAVAEFQAQINTALDHRHVSGNGQEMYIVNYFK